jgi:hypothetical protein
MSPGNRMPGRALPQEPEAVNDRARSCADPSHVVRDLSGNGAGLGGGERESEVAVERVGLTSFTQSGGVSTGSGHEIRLSSVGIR